MDLLDNGNFVETMNQLLEPSGVRLSDDGERWPDGYNNTREARIGKECGTLCPELLNTKIRDWWLAIATGANVPNWDLERNSS